MVGSEAEGAAEELGLAEILDHPPHAMAHLKDQGCVYGMRPDVESSSNRIERAW